MKKITLEQVQDFVTTLNCLTRNQRLFVLRTLTKEQMNILVMACFNLAKKADILQPETLKEVKKHRNKVHMLADKGYTLQEKRDTLTQRGGFVTTLLPILSTFLTLLSS